MKKKIVFYEIECDKCHKKAPIDNEKTNENWTVYKTGRCECGGIFKFNFDKPIYN